MQEMLQDRGILFVILKCSVEYPALSILEEEKRERIVSLERKCCYFYHVIDTQGMTLGVWMRRKRDT